MKPLSLEEIEKAGEIDISHGLSFNDLHTFQRVFYTAREYHRLKSLLEESFDELCDHGPEAVELITKHPGHRYWCNGHYVRGMEAATLYSRVREALRESEGEK